MTCKGLSRQVGRETDVSKTVCYCTHLTTFAGGWVVVPNTIDWSYVFANADFLSNPTIYITIILTGVLYLIGAIWARHRDKKISETVCGGCCLVSEGFEESLGWH